MIFNSRVYKDENEKFVMPCFAHADPDPDVTWHKYDIRVTPDYRRHIRENHTLAIEVLLEGLASSHFSKIA